MLEYKCGVCGQEIDMREQQRGLNTTHIPKFVDRYGVEALVERDQAVYEGLLCYRCWRERKDS